MKYRAIAVVTMPVGAVVKMAAPGQVHRRRHLTKPGKDGWCTVTAEFQFKAGEEFETDHGMSKATTEAIGSDVGASVALSAPVAEAQPVKQATIKAAKR